MYHIVCLDESGHFDPQDTKRSLIAGFISSTSAFLKPLSAKEEKMYLELYKNGDKSAGDNGNRTAGAYKICC